MTQRQLKADHLAFRLHRLASLEREIHYFRWARIRRFFHQLFR